MPSLTLYSTVGCHLCEKAESVLTKVKEREPNLAWHIVDIADDSNLTERYGIRIPVIALSGSDYDLGWPFDVESVLLYLDQYR